MYAGLPPINIAHVFIESGQSNCQGRGARVDAPSGSDPGPIAGVKTWRRNQTGTMYSGTGAWYDLDYEYNQYETRDEFGSVLQFGLDVSDRLYNAVNSIYIIKADGNGKPIAGWLSGGNENVAMYDGHLTPALADLEANPSVDVVKIHGFFFDQGEGDSSSSVLANAYQADLETVITDIRAATHASLPIILRRMHTDTPYTYGNTVRAAQQAVADAGTGIHLINGPYTYMDAQVHIDGDSQNTVGSERDNILKAVTTGYVYSG